MSILGASSFICDTAQETEKFGESLGGKLRGGEVIELISDLGGGKTTLVRGIARGAGSSDVVASPTFIINKIYQTPKFEIYHFDFYKLTEAGLMDYELQESLENPLAVIIIEWGDVMQHVLPDNRLTINIRKTADDSRGIEVSCPEDMAYLVSAK